MDFVGLVFLGTETVNTAAYETARTIDRDITEQAVVGKTTVFRYSYNNGTWHMTSSSKELRNIALALDFFISNVLTIKDVVAVRIGRGVPYFPACREADAALVVWWTTKLEDLDTFAQEDIGIITTRDLAGS